MHKASSIFVEFCDVLFTRVTNSQQVLPNISQLRNAVLPTSDDHLRHLDAMVQNRNANRNANPKPNPNANLDPNLNPNAQTPHLSATSHPFSHRIGNK